MEEKVKQKKNRYLFYFLLGLSSYVAYTLINAIFRVTLNLDLPQLFADFLANIFG